MPTSGETTTTGHLSRIREHYVVRNLLGALSLMIEDKSTMAYLGFLILVLLMGLVGPSLAPYQYDETQRDENGEIIRSAPPSLDHPLGTTDRGLDVLSRIMVGARPTVITGLLGGSLIIGIGMFVGITAGYVGGVVDDVLMRITDVAYGVPLIPFAIVLVTVIGVGFIQSVVVIGLLLWRGSARVLRSQVLQIKERPFILAAEASGASKTRIVVKHILPNVATMAILFFTLGIGYSIILQAGLAFIGVSSPFVPSWGIMLRNAYNSGLMSTAWWWSITPGLLIGLTVLSTFMFGRGYERVAGQTDEGEGALVQAG
jgi:peptide/nickel transport system permease protein